MQCSICEVDCKRDNLSVLASAQLAPLRCLMIGVPFQYYVVRQHLRLQPQVAWKCVVLLEPELWKYLYRDGRTDEHVAFL